MNRCTVLLTCVGGVYARDTIEALRDDREQALRIVGCDGNPDVVNRFAVDRFYRVSSAAEDAAAFIGEMLAICASEGVDIVLPSADEEVAAIANHLSSFTAAGIQCAVQSPSILDTLRNKLTLFRTLEANGVSVPPYAEVTDVPSLVSAAHTLGYPEAPFVLKPTTGRGARDITLIDASRTDLTEIVGTRGFRVGPLEAVCRTLRGHSLLAMEYLPGPAFDVDCLADNGVPYCIVVRRRLWKEPLSPVSQGCRIERDAPIEERAGQIVKALSLNHAVDMDFGMTRDGRPGLFEVNPRWSGSVAASRAGGVNIPAILVRKARGLPTLNTAVTPGRAMFPVTRMEFVDESLDGSPARVL
jgi:carbamoyl-phosphate synthase large subunit